MLMSGGFVPAPVLAKQTHTDGEVAGLHGPLRYLYLRKHEDESAPQEERGKTVFVANIPLGTNGASLQKFFSKFGPVEDIEVGKLSTGSPGDGETRVAHVTFSTRKGAEACMKVGTSKRDHGLTTIVANLKPEKRMDRSSSFERWMGRYSRSHPTSEDLRRQAEATISSFDVDEREREVKDLAEHNVADADGWVKVTASADRRGRNSDGSNITVHAASKGGMKKAQSKSKTSKQVVDFYRFQQREAKREHIATLRRKFEQDKERITRMRMSRSFKPLA